MTLFFAIRAYLISIFFFFFWFPSSTFLHKLAHMVANFVSDLIALYHDFVLQIHMCRRRSLLHDK